MELTSKLKQPKKITVSPEHLICFSHLKWDFVYQRPQHIMTRMSRHYKVYFIEEPVYHEGADNYEIINNDQVQVVKFYLNNSSGIPAAVTQRILLDKLLKKESITSFISWYYTPMALEFSMHLQPALTMYDCMDELSAFKFAPPQLSQYEQILFERSSLVFTGGHSLYEAKKHRHSNIYPFPSSIDKEHFGQARQILEEPAAQAGIGKNRIGFYGVIDERFNIKLVEELAAARPDWQLVLIGPVVKIEEHTLPRAANIHYLGGKTYKELPAYLSGWDICFIPFEKNESTRFISPTKTPEYLAAGKPVISSSIADVVNPYAVKNLVYIADNSVEFIAAAEEIFNASAEHKSSWLERTDEFLSAISWDITVKNMLNRIEATLQSATQTLHTENKFKSVA